MPLPFGAFHFVKRPKILSCIFAELQTTWFACE
jgi:hypothetical protein